VNSSKTDLVVLVDTSDSEVGTMEKLAAHQQGLLHRAISVFIFNSNGELLLQRRAFGKYHSEGLWTNTCCSHPYPEESSLDAANRRLLEEMGMTCDLSFAFKFTYHAELENNLIEHELDHVFIGYSDATPHLNTDEANAFRWASMDTLVQEIHQTPSRFTEWFKILIRQHIDKLQPQIV